MILLVAALDMDTHTQGWKDVDGVEWLCFVLFTQPTRRSEASKQNQQHSVLGSFSLVYSYNADRSSVPAFVAVRLSVSTQLTPPQSPFTSLSLVPLDITLLCSRPVMVKRVDSLQCPSLHCLLPPFLPVAPRHDRLSMLQPLVDVVNRIPLQFSGAMRLQQPSPPRLFSHIFSAAQHR